MMQLFGDPVHDDFASWALRFGPYSGAGMHCEMLNRSMANRKILDWLDDTLAKTGA